MRHGVHKIKFHKGQDSHQALLRKLVLNFIRHGKIETTLHKGKVLKATMDRLTGKAIRNSSSDKNMLMKFLTKKDVVSYMIDVVGPVMNKRIGGYVTIAKLGKRQGDDAEMTRLTWVEEMKAMLDKSKKVVPAKDAVQTEKISDKKIVKKAPAEKAAVKK